MRYSYSILIFCLTILLVFLSCESVQNRKITNTKILHKIEDPSENDFYHFVTNDQEYLTKVEGYTEDSISFIYVKNDIGFTKHSGSNYGNLLLRREEMQLTSIAKSDLISSPESRERNSTFTGKVILPTLNNNQPLMLHEITRYKDLNDIQIAVKDSVIERKIMTTYNDFKASTSLEHSLSFVDTASINYLSTILEKAATDDLAELKEFIMASEYPEADYQVVLKTRYLFLNDKNKKLTKEKLFKQFVPFYKMSCPSILSDNYAREDLQLNSVTLSSETTARAHFKATANTITQGNLKQAIMQIPFKVFYNLEDDQWKINLPSSYEYLQRQIAQITLEDTRKKGLGANHKYKAGRGEKEFRHMIRQNIQLFNPAAKIDNLLVY